jgi:hypothetical protein
LPWGELRDLVMQPGTTPIGDGSAMLGPWRALMTFVVWVLFPMLVISLIVWPEVRRKLLRRLFIGAIWTIFIYLLVNALQSRNQGSREGGAGAGDLQNHDAARLPTPPDFILHPPQWLIILVSLLLVTLAVLVVRWLMRRRAVTVEDVPLEEFAEEARVALAEIQAGGDLRGTVLRCYSEMSRVLSAERGIERAVGMTPREFEGHLQRAGVRDEHIQRLTRLFEAVRYGARTPGKREELEAVDCLTAIVQTYGGAV